MSEQKKRSFVNIIVWRDSVAAGDDIFAPHEIKIKVEDDEGIKSALEKILATRYLPSIQGGKATWILVGRKPLAVLAQQWSEPRYLVASNSHTKDLVESESDHQLDFLYWCQVEPNEIMESIVQGKPWPDRFGRDK
jgi:hypothetical protein